MLTLALCGPTVQSGGSSQGLALFALQGRPLSVIESPAEMYSAGVVDGHLTDCATRGKANRGNRTGQGSNKRGELVADRCISYENDTKALLRPVDAPVAIDHSSPKVRALREFVADRTAIAAEHGDAELAKIRADVRRGQDEVHSLLLEAYGATAKEVAHALKNEPIAGLERDPEGRVAASDLAHGSVSVYEASKVDGVRRQRSSKSAIVDLVAPSLYRSQYAVTIPFAVTAKLGTSECELHCHNCSARERCGQDAIAGEDVWA